MLERLSKSSLRALEAARKLARKLGHGRVSSAHLLATIVPETGEPTLPELLALGLDAVAIEQALLRVLPADAPAGHGHDDLSDELRGILEEAGMSAEVSGTFEVAAPLLLLALLEDPSGDARAVLAELRLALGPIRRACDQQRPPGETP